MDLWLVYYLSIGIVIGFIAGLLGVGGGAIMIPALSWAFVQRGYGGEHVMHMSLGTCMATIILVSISSARAHHTHGAVNWTMVRRMTPGIVVGGLVGTWLARSIPTVALAVMFAVFMCYVAFNMFTGWKPKGSRTTLGWAGTSGAGFVEVAAQLLAARARL